MVADAPAPATILQPAQSLDTQADGGCHVATLSEIGRLVLTRTENKGKITRRVDFVLE